MHCLAYGDAGAFRACLNARLCVQHRLPAPLGKDARLFGPQGAAQKCIITNTAITYCIKSLHCVFLIAHCIPQPKVTALATGITSTIGLVLMTLAAGGGGSNSSGALLLPGWCLLACGGGGMHVSGFHVSNLYGARKKEASSMLSAAFGERPRASLSLRRHFIAVHRIAVHPPQVVVRSSFLCSSSPRSLAARASPQSWRFTRPLVPFSP